MVRVSENAPYHNLDLKSCSFFSSESEVLLLPNFYFEVIRVKKKRHYTFIEIKEIAHQNILSLEKLDFPKIVWVTESFALKKKPKSGDFNEDREVF